MPKSKSNTTRPTLSLPKGFKPITGGAFAPSWDYRKEPEIQGKILSFGSVQSKYGKGKVQRNCVIATQLGERTVWESAGTSALFTGEDFKGKRVAIVYLGDKKIPGRKLPMHDFAVGVA